MTPEELTDDHLRELERVSNDPRFAASAFDVPILALRTAVAEVRRLRDENAEMGKALVNAFASSSGALMREAFAADIIANQQRVADEWDRLRAEVDSLRRELALRPGPGKEGS